jgi:hypothetical protein
VTSISQRNFAAGEISPSLYGRTDQLKYATGLRQCRNFIVQRHGGVANRAGTEYVGATKNNGAVRLIKFVFNDGQTYVLEFGDQYIRWFTDGGRLVVSGVTAWLIATAYVVGDLRSDGGVTYYCTVAHTSGATTEPGVGTAWQSNWYAFAGVIYEIPSPYLVADLDGIQVVQSADVLTIVHKSYAPRELRRYGATNWTLAAIAFGPSVALVGTITPTGGTAGTIRYWAVTAVGGDGDEEGLPSVVSGTNLVPTTGTATVLTWNPVPTAIAYNIYRSLDGTSYGFVAQTGGTPATRLDTTWTTATSNVTTTTVGATVAASTQARNPVVAVVADKAFDGNYTIVGQLTVSAVLGAPTLTQGYVRVYYSRGGEPRVDAGTRFGAAVFGASSTVSPFTIVLNVPDNGYSTLTIDLVPEVYGSGTGPPSFSAQVDATSISNGTVTLSYSDVALAPDYSISPPTQRTLFASTGAYPGVVGQYQQRRGFADSINNPETVWFSRIGSRSSFAISTPLQDDDAVTFSLAGRQVNEVRHMIDLGRLVIFTSGGEFMVEGDANGILTPSAVNLRQQLYHGAALLPPIIIGNAALYVQARGTIVRDLVYDSIESFKTNDLTLFASHLFDGYSLADWDFQQVQHSTLWAVRSDGTMVALTYLREQEIYGWHRHDTDGVIERVCVVPEGETDAVYLVVRRTINGGTVRYVERMVDRTITDLTDVRDLFFVDCGLTYDGRNTTAETMTLSGGVLWDEGEQVTITRSVGGFTALEIGNAIFFTDATGRVLRVNIEAYTSTTVMIGRAVRTIPVELRGVATTTWSRAVETLAGLDHLEGKAVSVFGDGAVVASPNNAAYTTVVTVTGGKIVLPNPYAVVHVGLPYLSDLETLDIDTPQGASLKTSKMLINKVTVVVEKTRGLWWGGRPPTDDRVDPLERLDEMKIRDASDSYDPIALRTDDFDAVLQGRYNTDGRVFLRQVDPIPATVLAIMPQGVIPAPR